VSGAVKLTARWVVGFDGGRHRLIDHGEIVWQGDRIVFVGRGWTGEAARQIDAGFALAGPGFVDLDALADLDTTILGYGAQPAWRKGRVWPRSYLERGPFEMYDAAELAFQKRYAFAHLLRNGVTTALPIASLFYRAWGETVEEFEEAASIAGELGLRVYLGPAYRTGNQLVEADGALALHFDEARGLAELERAVAFARRVDGRHGGRVRAMLAPDRLETCTEQLIRRTAAAAAELGCPFRQHSAQSRVEYDWVRRLHGRTPIEWLHALGALGPRALLPHGIFLNDHPDIADPGRDRALLRESGATIVHCPIVFARGGQMLDSLARMRDDGIRVALGTDTWPPDMIENMKLGALLCRLIARDPGACSAADLYDAATLGGAAALGRDDLGRLAPGAKADIAVIDLSGPHLGQVVDPVRALLLAASGRDVRHVVVDGRVVVEDGRIPGIDWDEFARRAQAQFEKLVALYPRRTWRHPQLAEIFPPSYPPA